MPIWVPPSTGMGGGTGPIGGSGCCCGSGSGGGTLVACNGCPLFAPADYRIRVTRLVDTSDIEPPECTLDFDVSGILKVTAQDRNTGQQKHITVEASLARLSDDEIVDAQAWVAQAIEAVAPTVGAVSPAEAGVLVDRAMRLLAGGELMPEDRDALQGLLAEIQVAQVAGDPSRLQELLDALLDLLFDLEED